MRALIVLLCVGCQGGGVGSECHLRGDCDEELVCAGPNDPPACGIPPREACVGDGDCGGDRCHAIDDSCSRDGIGSECGAACSGDLECGAGFRCAGGACVALSCDGETTCPARQVCDPARITASTPVYDRHHGCFDVACGGDGECGVRSCVNGYCQDGPGTCERPLLVP